MNAQHVGLRLGLTLVAGLALLPPATARAQNLTNGGATWSVSNSSFGFSINDASLPGHGDAFDSGLLLFLDNTAFAGPSVTSTPTSANSGVGSLAGLNVDMNYRALGGSPTLRTFITLTNPTSSAISVTASWVTNVGSDAGTQVITTGSGDQTFTTADRYVITDDNPAGVDPTNTFILFGTGSPLVTPTSVTRTVFSSAGTEGIRANFSLSIPGGATQSLLFFNQLHVTSADAIAALSAFATNPSGELISGLSQEQLATVVNFQFGPTSSVPEPGSLALLGTGVPAVLGMLYRRRRAARRG